MQPRRFCMQRLRLIPLFILCVFLTACFGDDKKKTIGASACSNSVTIDIGDGITPKNGITVVKKGNATEDEANRVKEALKTRIEDASCHIKGLFAKKKVIIGLIDHEGHRDVAGFFKGRKSAGYDAVELVYTDKEVDGNSAGHTSDNEANEDEVANIACEKMMQIFDYYIADETLDREITEAYLDIKSHTGVNYNNCEAYGNAVQTDPSCEAGDEGSSRDEAHPAGIDLNPGAVLGKICEYQLDPDHWNPPGEFRGILDTNYQLDDEEFDKMKAFLRTHFGITSS